MVHIMTAGSFWTGIRRWTLSAWTAGFWRVLSRLCCLAALYEGSPPWQVPADVMDPGRALQWSGAEFVAEDVGACVGGHLVDLDGSIMPAAATAPPLMTAMSPSPVKSSAGNSAATPVTAPGIMVPRDLISARLFDKLTFRVMTDHDMAHDTAERVVTQSLAFLVACALNPDGHLSPSKAVDTGCHAFILHTADYAAFCDRVAGRFIHHHPTGPDESEHQQTMAATTDAMRSAGLHVDAALWNLAPDCTSDCHQCHAGCHDSPGRA